MLDYPCILDSHLLLQATKIANVKSPSYLLFEIYGADCPPDSCTLPC